MYYTYNQAILFSNSDMFLINDNYKKCVIKNMGKEKGEIFIKNNPLLYNEKLNRMQNFKIK